MIISTPCELLEEWLAENMDPNVGKSMLVKSAGPPAPCPSESNIGRSATDGDIAMDDLVSVSLSGTRQSLAEPSISTRANQR